MDRRNPSIVQILIMLGCCYFLFLPKPAHSTSSFIMKSKFSIDTDTTVNRKISSPLVKPDKIQHFTMSLISTVLFYKLSETELKINPGPSKQIAAGLTFGLGIAKEIRDSTRRNNYFSLKDLLANLAGIGVGMILINQP
ncbi:MAG: hypothetical protein Kow0042_07000 [Calditrichia bacterium]